MPYDLEKVKNGYFVKNTSTGQRKNNKPMPRNRAVAYMRALYAAEERSKKKEFSEDFTVMKQADGSYRWVLFSSNAYQDRDKEIVSSKALEADVDLTDSLKEYGPLRWWHIGGFAFDDAADYTTYKAADGLDIGDCDFRMLSGKVLIESGTFRDQSIAEAIAPIAKDLQASIRFSHPRTEPDAEGVFTHVKTFERSLLPKGRASNRFTQLLVTEVDEMTDVKEKIQAFVALLKDDELVKSILDKADTITKEADKAGVASKETQAAVDDKAALTKNIAGTEHPASDFLVVEDPKQVTTWRLPVKTNGKPDHRLMGGAKAALTDPKGHRGKKYAGPNKAEATSELKKMYEAEKMTWDDSTAKKEEEPEIEGFIDDAFEDVEPVVTVTPPVTEPVVETVTEPVTETPKEAAVVEEKEMSFDDIRTAVWAAMKEGSSGDVGIQDLFDDWFIYIDFTSGGLFRQMYSIDDNGVAVLEGEPIEVTRHTVYLPADQSLMVAQPAQMEPVITGLKEIKELVTAQGVVSMKAQDDATAIKEATEAQLKRIQALEAELTTAKAKLDELTDSQPRSVKQLKAQRATESKENIVSEKNAEGRKPGPDKNFMDYVLGGQQPG